MMKDESNGEDLRTTRTKRALLDSLLRLIEEIGYEAVTVSELCTRAYVNRSTFYRYYEDKDDLLFRGTEALFDEFSAIEREPPTDLRSAAAAPPLQLVSALEHISRHRNFYSVMLGPKGVPAYRARIEEYHRTLIGARIRAVLTLRESGYSASSQLAQGRIGGMNETRTIEYIIAGAAGALSGMIRDWLDHGCSDAPEEVASAFLMFVGSGIEVAL